MESMPDRGSSRRALLALLALAALAPAAHAQDIEPRAYSNAPVGVNFVIAGLVFTRGGLNFDNALPITGEHLESTNAVFAYARTLDFGGKSGKFDVIVPMTHLQGSAQYLGQPVERDIHGLGRPAFRVSVNLFGAPALRLKDFAGWKQDLIVGASLQLSPAWGQYDPDRLVNIGQNRWTAKAEVGVSKARGAWIWELQAAGTFFGDNDDFFGGHERSQAAIWSLQGHAIHSFASGKWLSLDATWFTGGRSTLDDVAGDDLQRNWRAGAILAIPVDRRNSLKLSASSGLWARTGNSFDALGVAWQYRWGGGL
jgi:hypothetical protein